MSAPLLAPTLEDAAGSHRSAVVAFVQYLMVLCFLNAVMGVIRLHELDAGNQRRWPAAQLVVALLAGLGVIGAIWALSRPGRLTVAVWSASASVLASGGLSVWLSRTYVVWDFWPAIAVVVYGNMALVPVGWVAFAVWAGRVLTPVTAPVPTATPERSDVGRSLSYRAPEGHRRPGPLTRTAAFFLLVHFGCMLLANVTAQFVLGTGIPSVSKLMNPAWLVEGGLNYVQWWLIPAILVGAAALTLWAAPPRRYMTLAVGLWLGTAFAIAVRDTLAGVWADNLYYFRGTDYLVTVNFAIFLLRALRQGW